MSVSVCSTLSGKVALKHPELGVLVREDGAVLTPTYRVIKSKPNYQWSFGQNGLLYKRVSVGKKMYMLHRLVAEVFVPNPDNKPTVDHINRDKHDNRAVNLRWATMREQSHNTIKWIRAEDCGLHESTNRTEYAKMQYQKHKQRRHEDWRKYYKLHKDEINAKKRARYRQQQDAKHESHEVVPIL